MTLDSRPARRRSLCTVLVVDDDDATRFTERLVLEHFGFVVREACTGLQALAMAQANPPRIVLLDIVLPEIDGCQLARMLRGDPATCHTAIVAVSAAAGDEERESALRAGCDEFLSKPIPPRDLAGIMARYARRPAAYDFDPLERNSSPARL